MTLPHTLLQYILQLSNRKLVHFIYWSFNIIIGMMWYRRLMGLCRIHSAARVLWGPSKSHRKRLNSSLDHTNYSILYIIWCFRQIMKYGFLYGVTRLKDSHYETNQITLFVIYKYGLNVITCVAWVVPCEGAGEYYDNENLTTCITRHHQYYNIEL